MACKGLRVYDKSANLRSPGLPVETGTGSPGATYFFERTGPGVSSERAGMLRRRFLAYDGTAPSGSCTVGPGGGAKNWGHRHLGPSAQ